MISIFKDSEHLGLAENIVLCVSRFSFKTKLGKKLFPGLLRNNINRLMILGPLIQHSNCYFHKTISIKSNSFKILSFEVTRWWFRALCQL